MVKDALRVLSSSTDHNARYQPAPVTITNNPISRLDKLFLFAPERGTGPVGTGAGTKLWAGVKSNPVGKSVIVQRDDVEVEVDESVSVVSQTSSVSVALVRVLLSDVVVRSSVRVVYSDVVDTSRSVDVYEVVKS